MLSYFPCRFGVSSRTIALGAAGFCTAAVLVSIISNRESGPRKKLFIESPRRKIQRLPGEAIRSLPYPPDILPGGRDAATPYGSIRIFEWGPEDGEKVLILHGISTPTISQGDLAHELVAKGYRVMLFGKSTVTGFTSHLAYGMMN